MAVFPVSNTACNDTPPTKLDAVKANEAVVANDADVANEADVAKDADVAKLAEDAFCTLFVVRANVLPSPLVYVVVAFDIDAVTNAFGVNDADVANEALVAKEAEVANDADTATEALVAFEAVTVRLFMFEPVPSVKMLPEICTNCS